MILDLLKAFKDNLYDINFQFNASLKKWSNF